MDKTPIAPQFNHQPPPAVAAMSKENNNPFTVPFDQMPNSNVISSPTPQNATKSASPLQNSSTTKRSQRNNVPPMTICIKSPNKSPGKSPRQMEMVRQRSESSRGRARGGARNSNSTARGRGAASTRARGGRRASHIVPMPNALIEMNCRPSPTIHNSLQGTVYDLDFDEDPTDMENFKSIRDHRRRSIDCRQVRDASQSPKVTAASNQKRMVFTPNDIRDLRPPSPIRQDANAAPMMGTPPVMANVTPPVHTMQSAIPGPVDMRTFNPPFDTTANNEVFNSSMLGVFAGGIPDQTLPAFDEESEKDFQSALKGSITKPTPVTIDPPKASPVAPIISEPQQPSVTIIEAPAPLSHSSNATGRDDENAIEPPKHSLIKLKIKGPHARPENYTSSVITSYPTVTIEQQGGAPNTNTKQTARYGMRKKELLRQYLAPENMDDSNCAQPTEQITNMSMNPTNSGRSAGIPKAVDSMSSIPTKDDYKDYTIVETKKRKAGLSRELRHLDSYNDVPERRRSVCSNASNTSSSNAGDNGKRKTRTKQAMMMTTPKLTIKIGSSIIEPSVTGDFGNVRPPKKRLANMDVMSMDFRKKTKSSGGDDDKSKAKKKKKRDEKREEKRRKKKEKKHQVEIVSSECSTSKLIIRFAKKKAEDANHTSESIVDEVKTNSPICAAPLRLKIARNSQGGGYGVVETPATQIITLDANCQLVDIQNEVKSTEHDDKLLSTPHHQNTDSAGASNASTMPAQTLPLPLLPMPTLMQTGKSNIQPNSIETNATPFAVPHNNASHSSEPLTMYLSANHHPLQQIHENNQMANNNQMQQMANATPNEPNAGNTQENSVQNVGSLLALSKDCEVR